MKNTLFFLFSFSALLFFSCAKDPIKSEWETYCDETALGGEINLTIDGKNWETGCVHSIYSETVTADYSSKILWIYGYNYGSTFYTNSDVEVFYAIYSEVTVDGQTEIETDAVFFDGFTVDVQNTGTLDGKYFESDESPNDEVNITELTSNKAKGTLSFKLFNEEDSSEEISVTGNFEAVIEQ